MSTISKESKICIIGAGPGGLSSGYFLQKAGYKYVTILEKSPEVGGLCNTITFENKSFDLGANYLTPAYKKTLKLAKEVGAKLYTETKAYCYDPNSTSKNKYSTILQAVTKNGSFWTFSLQAVKYFYERWKVKKHLPKAGFSGVSQHPDLTCTFDEWLVDKKLTALRPLFEIPVTLMGYGKLTEIPAPYALTYMSLPTYWSLIVFGSGLPTRWPKRFIHGFQRFWEKVSWDLTVIKNAEITKIERGAKVKVHFTTKEHSLNRELNAGHHLEFDYLIVAVPLTFSIVNDLFTDKQSEVSGLTEEESHLFKKVVLNPFCLTTFKLDGLDLPRRLINVLPVQDIGTPYVVTQQFKGNPLVSFYSRTNSNGEPKRKDIIENVKKFYHKLGSEFNGDCYTHDEWSYFPHVSVLDIKEGFYDTLEAMQGKNKTFFVGGLMAFELIEPIINYSENLVKTHFTGS